MNSLQQPRAGSFGHDRSANDLDGLLRAFFRAQVPEPWPAPKPPATSSLRGEGALVRRPSLFRSRFALAASLLILLISQLFVSNMFSGYAHFSADRDSGGLEATNVIDSAMPREPRPVSRLKKAEVIRQSDRIPVHP
jgi:hypothetical protein